jgi:citrate lyase gamma subunit
VSGTNSDAVFFTVVNHPQGNKQVAGLLIAAPSGPNQMEAALVSDDAAHFGSTVNPMLNRLFSEWHPGGGGQASGPATDGRSAPPEPLQRVVNQDGSASLAIPYGWKVQGNGGTTMVVEPHYNVVININLVRGATNPSYSQPYGRATGMAAKMVYPSNVDPVKGFPGLLKEFYRVNNQRIDFRIAQTEQVAGPPGQRCVHAIGHGLLFPAGQAQPNVQEKDYWEMEMLMCTSAPNGMGDYVVTLSISEIDPRFADKERATVGAILSSYQVNEAVVAREAGAIAAPAIDAIHRIGAAATARMKAVERANDAQHADYYARQDANARSGQGFSNYLLDQTVIQDNNVYGNGTIGHGTVWNSTADALVKANPNRYEIVNAPNFWKGWDY